MVIELLDLVFVFALALAVFYWWKAREAKERAFHYLKHYCEKMQVSLLDDSLVLSGIGFKRNPEGHLSLKRCYRFEFSTTGERRYTGIIESTGSRLFHVAMAPHEELRP